tara:strand:+ start:102 stop:1661 length:1560 start_codon:yes stop_codon:yes gene_type:complete
MLNKNHSDEYLKLKDGVNLISRIWLPSGKGPWPALLMRQPYGREIASTITYAHPTWWTSKGYMVVIQDVRGQGDSEGIFRGFSQEASDTSETHEWVRSLKNCNGKLGLYGFSYQGLTQLTGEEYSLPPDCLSPAMTGLKIKEHWCAHGDAFFWNNNISWALQIAALKMKREKNTRGWEKIRSSFETKTHLTDGLKILREIDPENFIISWLDNLNKNHKFEDIKPLSSWLKKPMLILGGLWDPHLRGALDLYKRSKDEGGNPELVISDSTHLNWWKNSQNLLLDFFDKHLKNKDILKLNSLNNKKIWNISTLSWDNIENKSLNYEFSLSSEGIANVEVKDGSLISGNKGSGFFTLVHDPWRPVPSDGGHLGQNPGFFDRKNIDKRFDVAVFQTNFLKEKIHLSGIPILFTSVISDQESFDICLALSLIDSDEKAVSQFSTGFLRVKNNQQKIYAIEFQPINISVSKGNKLRLSISASAWPAIGVNTGLNNKHSGQTTLDHRVITLNFDLSKTIMKINPFF